MQAKTNINIKESKIRCTVSPKMYGLFFEEINHGGDGGLYGEMIQNRNFMNSVIPEGTVYYNGKAMTRNTHIENFDIMNPLPGWSLFCENTQDGSMEPWILEPRNQQVPNQIKMDVYSCGKTAPKLINSGYWGMCVKHECYKATIILRSNNIKSIKIALEKDGEILGEGKIDSIGPEFEKYVVTIECQKAVKGAVFTITPQECGTIYFDYVSLFPVNTYKGRENGMRRDLAEALEKLRPGFIRFPGGCITEGINMENSYRACKTIGPVEDRIGSYNLWGYRRTDGIGFHEFLQLSEDLNADAMYVCNCGMSCQARKSEEGTDTQIADILQDTLNAIEYAIGDYKTTKWGSLRAKYGHPEPFPLKYVEIGNENSGGFYQKTYRIFYQRLKKEYPQLLYIINDASGMDDSEYDILDEHYYCEPMFFPAIADKYDDYSRNKQIYVGEYACNTNVGIGNMVSAASEASFMIGMEKNADVVKMASFAPLFCHVNNRVWPVNLINFDSGGWFGIPSYYLQYLFRDLLPETIVSCESNTISFTQSAKVFANAGILNGNTVVKTVNFSDMETVTEFMFEQSYSKVYIYSISADNPEEENSLEEPEKITIQNEVNTVEGKKWRYILKPYGIYGFVFEK